MNDGAIFIALGSTNVSLIFKLYNATTGALETGITVTDLNIDYIRVETDNDVTIAGNTNLTALSALTDAHANNKALEIGQGYYRVDTPDAAFAVGAIGGAVIITHDSDTTLPATIDWQANLADDVKKLIRADKVIDTGETPWVVDYKEEGTETVLMAKTMKNTAGENVTTKNNVLGQLEQE